MLLSKYSKTHAELQISNLLYSHLRGPAQRQLITSPSQPLCCLQGVSQAEGCQELQEDVVGDKPP